MDKVVSSRVKFGCVEISDSRSKNYLDLYVFFLNLQNNTLLGDKYNVSDQRNGRNYSQI